MIIADQLVKIKVRCRNILHFKDLGFNVRRGDILHISLDKMPSSSSTHVQVICDYCNAIIEKRYSHFLRDQGNGSKDACINCKHLKKLDTMKLKYGVMYPLQSAEIRNKVKNTNLMRYGVENPSQDANIQKKIVDTNLRKYGVERPAQSKVVQAKMQKTTLKRFGVTNAFQCEQIKQRIRLKSAISYYKHGTGIASRQQKYLAHLLTGELNYPVDGLRLDIAFPDEKLYIEFDGGGHTLSVKRGLITKEKFLEKERNRFYFLLNRGWKLIRIISSLDLLPEDHKIFELVYESKEYLSKGHSWIHVDVDNGELKCSQYTKPIELGILHTITKEMII